MIISPIDVIRFQACPRRYFLERTWRVIRRRPKTILDACLRSAVVALSAGGEISQVRAEARAALMAEAADPGMAVPEGSDPYQIASDLCAVLDTSLTAISMLTLLPVQSVPTVPLPANTGSASPTSTYEYAPLSLVDESGCLHRWLTVDVWDDDAATRELHSWVTAGDMAVCDAPLTLHVVVIGQQRNGRQQSPWCRAHEQPLTRRLRFLRRNGHHNGKGGERRPPIPPDWKTVWYADLAQPDPEAWVRAMCSDEIMPRLLHHPAIAEFPSEVRRQTLAQLSMVADSMARTAETLSTPLAAADDPEPAMSLPMSRAACDGMVPCPWALACYRADPAHGIATLGAYSRRGASGRGDGRRGSRDAQPHMSGIVGSRGSATTSGGDGIRTAIAEDVSL